MVTAWIPAIHSSTTFPASLKRGQSYEVKFTVAACTGLTYEGNYNLELPKSVLKPLASSIFFWPRFLAKPLAVGLKGKQFSVRFTVPKSAALGAGSESVLGWVAKADSLGFVGSTNYAIVKARG